MPIIDVPLIGQWGLYANAYRNDCGVACTAMCLEYYGIRGNLTVDALATETALSVNDGGLTCQQLVTLCARHGLQASVHWNTVLDDLRAEIDALRPVVALVNYGYISERLDQQFKGWHFFVIVGYDTNHFVVNDPDYWQPYLERGHDILIPIRELELALVGYSGQCVFMEQPMSISDQLIAHLDAADVELDAARTLAAQVSDTPPTLPGTTMITTDRLNVRAAPVSGDVMAVLEKGATLQVIDASPSPWKQIVYGPYTSRYVSGAFLANP